MAKILILANFDVGLYKFRKELIQKLLEEKHQVYLSLPDGDLIRPLEEMGCTFIDTPLERRGMNPATDLQLLKRYKQILQEVQPDLVITYTIKPNIYGGLACKRCKVPYAINITGLGTAFQKEGMLRKMVIRMYHAACKKARVVFFENEENRQVFLTHHIIRKEQAVSLNGAGVNLEDYAFTDYPSEAQGIRFLFIGRVMQEKGVDELFAAARVIKARYPDVQFDIVGPYEDDYETTVRQLEAEGIIHFHGYQEDVRPFIAQSHCFVLPSWHEGMANTLLETAAMGRPLITNDIPGCREAVEEGKNGLLCRAKDTESLTGQLEHFLQLKPEERAKMGKISRQRMEQIFDKKKVVAKTIEALHIR